MLARDKSRFGSEIMPLDEDALELLFLGTGTSHGIPMIGCDCEVCRSDDPRDNRTRASVLLSWSGRNVVIDTGAEFRVQVLRYGVTRLDAVLYTHSHADHIHGIDDIRAFSARMPEPMPVYASPGTAKFFRRTFAYIFSPNLDDPNIPRVVLSKVDAPFTLFGKTVVPVPIEHGSERIVGYRVDGLAYLTDCSGIPRRSWPLIDDLDVLIIGALRPTPHPKHFSLDQALEVVERARPRRTWLTHISHRLGSAATIRGLPEGVELAYDGLRIDGAGRPVKK